MHKNQQITKNTNKKEEWMACAMLNTKAEDIEQLLLLAQRSSDFISSTIAFTEPPLTIHYYKTLIDEHLLQEQLLRAIENNAAGAEIQHLNDLKQLITIEGIQITDQIADIQSKLYQGYAVIQKNEHDALCALVPLISKAGLRKSNDTDNEFSVVGPKVGFVEDLDINLHLIRSQFALPNLIIKTISIGSLSNSRVAIIYIDGITSKENVAIIEQRLSSIDFEVVFDTAQLDQIISDNSLSPFPLFVSTERRDRVIYSLISGQVAVISDGSPYFITGPSTLYDFFISPEDYYLPWILGSFFRIIRILGVAFSLFASALYTAITTFHYEVIPKDLLQPLIFSRQNVPFSPVLEVLFLEITIEFLREAGARLPTKIGQTLGIVGGIIVGQAAVEAALTSNILIIIVSLSALASFATPIYKMSNTIRFLRFPVIIMASFWGAIGMIFGICFILIHITRLTSLGSPYTVPLYPLRPKDLRDSFIRSSYQFTNKRQSYLKPETILRYMPKPRKKKTDWEQE
ncbi:spore germination protein [Paenibacillus chondroitinus]|uniref:Spore germination protein n=2 Tax=Paenibacillus TaxID=44249 RepID=A0ABU6D9U4_9BACL|nr:MULTISPECIES: spore germination protein [Paenibacillus]MCY9656867.1 spore germination protein [Paenibacillus anseongense]MEB4794517.1 spore germination protein [Paenibacillus chondroitinus]